MREAYNLFNEISDQLYGPENCKDNSGENQKTEEDAGDEEDEDEDEDIDAAFEKEKTELTEMGKKTSSGERRFQVQRHLAGQRELIRISKVVESGARNCVFIKTTLEEPHKLIIELINRFFRLTTLRNPGNGL